MPGEGEWTPPVATYRLQLTQDFNFEAAAELAEYLAELGISHVYTSPSLQAGAGSTHGYDVVDHSRASEDLGGTAAHQRMCERFLALGLRQLIDVVPNHMYIGSRANAWWWDVLKFGFDSPYSGYFDIMWEPPEQRLRKKVLLPLLHTQFGRVIDDGAITVVLDSGEFVFQYYGNEFPLAPHSLSLFLNPIITRTNHLRLGYLLDALADWGADSEPAPKLSQERVRSRRRRDLLLLLEDLGSAVEEPDLAQAVQEEVARLNQDKNRLELLLRRQHYRLAHWRIADYELNYRRFFNVGSLAGLRMETDQVFLDTHRLVLEWYRNGWIHGFRIDHPDGLYDPEYYLQRLRDAAPEAYLVVEKVLERGERLPSSWPVHGTTGYNFLNIVGGLYVDAAGESRMTRFCAEFTQEEPDYEKVLLREKRRVLEQIFAAELARITAVLMDVCERHRRHRDYVRRELAEVLSEVLVHFPVYRTYTRPVPKRRVTQQDSALIREAVRNARQVRPELDPELFDFLERLLCLKVPGEKEDEFVQRFQQLTSPLMAKGAEDTAFYVYNRLLCLNEVGGDPGHFGVSIKEFHRECTHLQRKWPLGMLNTSTHDTKRSEDVRSRLALLSEIPRAWKETVLQWAQMNEPLRTNGFPDRKTEYTLYQLLVGAWPIELDRMRMTMTKSVREAKQFTNWSAPDEAFEKAVAHFVAGLYASDAFLASLENFVRPLIVPGRINALSQTLIKLTAPGVPDLYQGTELWDLSLVDPDNRRPVDFEQRRALLAQVKELHCSQCCPPDDAGRAKLYVTYRTLQTRRAYPEWFGAKASYEPLWARGPGAAHVVAFARSGSAITITPRLVLRRTKKLEDTEVELPEGQWREVFSGAAYPGGGTPVSRLLGAFPVALMVRME